MFFFLNSASSAETDLPPGGPNLKLDLYAHTNTKEKPRKASTNINTDFAQNFVYFFSTVCISINDPGLKVFLGLYRLLCSSVCATVRFVINYIDEQISLLGAPVLKFLSCIMLPTKRWFLS